MRELKVEIGEWRSRMAASGLKSPAVLDELESHLREEIERQMRSGTEEMTAFAIAVDKIGGSEVLKAEFAKISRSREIPIGRVVGIACCVTTAAYSLMLAPALVTVPELDWAHRVLGLGALFLTLFFLVSLRFSHKFLPVIHHRRARVALVSACAMAGLVWVFAFSNLLPDVLVPRLMARAFSETQAVPMREGYAHPVNSLQVHNTVSLGGDNRLAQPGYGGDVLRHWRQSESAAALRPVFDIGISLFWAMTLAAALGGLAYGLEEAAKRRSTERAYV